VSALASTFDDRSALAERLAEHAVQALVEEALLTPKPGLVDRRGSGAHADLDLERMLRSARALRGAFAAMARAAAGQRPSQPLREVLAAIGREGEAAMLEATGGSNAHRGAIWAIGLLVAGAVTHGANRAAAGIAARGAAVARHEDRFAPSAPTNGARARTRYRVGGAPAEATSGFPHALKVGLPALVDGRRRGLAEEEARLDALLAIMALLEDTCLLHRGGLGALEAARRGAAGVLALGGVSTPGGRDALSRLDAWMRASNLSPGGTADLLAAVLFLDRVTAPASAPPAGGAPRRG